MTQDQAKKVYDKLQKSADDKVQSEKITQAQAMYQATLELTEGVDRQAQLDQYRTMLNYFKYKDIKSYVGRFSNPLEGVEGTLVGQYANIQESLSYATELSQKTEIERALNSFSMELKQSNVWQAFHDPAQSNDVANEIYGVDTGNSMARTVANIYKKNLEDLRLQQNQLGADIGKLDEYIGEQSHNPERLLQTAHTYRERVADRFRSYRKNRSNYGLTNEELQNKAFENWKNFIMPLLDYKRTFEGVTKDSVDQFMRGAWEGLTTGRHFGLDEPEPLDFNNKPKLFKNFADKLGAERKIHFKDGTSWETYSKQYGNGSVNEAMVSSIRRAGANIGLLSKWGPNPRRMFDITLNDAMDKASRLAHVKKAKLGRTKARLQAYFDMLDGTAFIPVDFMGAKTGQALRSWQGLSKLGMMVFSNFGDIANHAEMMRTMGDNPINAYFTAITNMMKGRPEGEQRMLAESIGVWAEAQFGHMSAAMADATNSFGRVSKVLMLFNKLTLNEWWEETSRLGLGTYVSRTLALLKNSKFDELPMSQRTNFRMYGINEKEWNLMRSNNNVYKVLNGTQFITPDAVWGYSDESIAKYLDKDVSELKNRDIDTVKRDMNKRLMSFFIDKTDDANLRPGIKTRYTLTRGTRPGTWMGEGARMIGQFKYYSVEYGRRVLGRKIFGVKQDLGHGLQAGSPDVAGLVNVLIGSTILGYVGMQSKNILKNKTIRPLSSPGTYLAALLQGGGLGLYGDFLFGQSNRFGQSMLESLAGPVPVSLSQGAQILVSLEHLQDPVNQMNAYLKNNIPLLNLFYLRTSLDFLFLNGLTEMASPGAMQRYQTQISKDNDQQFIINPLVLSPWAK